MSPNPNPTATNTEDTGEFEPTTRVITAAEPPIVLAFSGGLDTSWCVVHLLETQNRGVVTVTVDTGGFDAEELARIEKRAHDLGATQHVTVDGRPAVFERFVRYLIAGNCLRGSVYPLCVAAERIVQAEQIALAAERAGADVVAHGSTGAGNDQVRFDVALRVLLPGATLLAPVRQHALSRPDQHQILNALGHETSKATRTFSVNRGLWGNTMGGGALHDPTQPVPADCWQDTVDPDEAPEGGVEVEIGFEAGVPISLNGEVTDGVALVTELGKIGAAQGVGRGVHVGDTILGIKGRLAFEAPAAVALVTAHRELEKLVLTKRQLEWKERVGASYAALVHEANYYDPVARDLEAFLTSTQRAVSGRVRLKLVRGRVEIVTMHTDGSLLGRLGAVYGESAGWSGADGASFSKLYGLPQVIASRRDTELYVAEASAPGDDGSDS